MRKYIEWVKEIKWRDQDNYDIVREDCSEIDLETIQSNFRIVNHLRDYEFSVDGRIGTDIIESEGKYYLSKIINRSESQHYLSKIVGSFMDRQSKKMILPVGLLLLVIQWNLLYQEIKASGGGRIIQNLLNGNFGVLGYLIGYCPFTYLALLVGITGRRYRQGLIILLLSIITIIISFFI